MVSFPNFATFDIRFTHRTPIPHAISHGTKHCEQKRRNKMTQTRYTNRLDLESCFVYLYHATNFRIAAFRPLTLSLSLSAGCRFQSHTFTFQLTLTYRKNVISKVCVESLLCGKSVDFSTSWKVPKNKKQRRYYLAVAQQKVFQTLLCLTNCWNENGKSWDRMPIRKNTILLLLTTLWVCTRAMNMGTNFRSKFKRSTGKESFNWSICWFLDSQIFLLFGCPLFNILTYSKQNITW